MIHDDAQTLWALLVKLNELTHAQCENVFVFDIVEVGKEFDDFFLHIDGTSQFNYREVFKLQMRLR